MRRLVFSLAAMASTLTAAAGASAYTLQPTADGSAPVRWSARSVSVVVDPTVHALGPGAEDAVRAAFAAWDKVDGAAPPEVTLTQGQVDEIGYRTGDANASTVRYLPQGFAEAGDALAVTVTTSDQAGNILDADIVVNGVSGRRFGVVDADLLHVRGGDPNAVYDLQNFLTHEAGHFFGLGEAPDFPDDTMYPTSAAGETKKRSLEADDVGGARALYAPSQATDGTAAVGACDVAPGAAHGSWWGLAAVAVAAALAFRRRARTMALALPFGFAGALAAASAPAAPVKTHRASAAAGSAAALVTAVDARWEGGLVVSSIELSVRPCASCAPMPASLEVLGGSIDGLTQTVSGRRVPAAGEPVALPPARGGFAWPQELAPRRGTAVRETALVLSIPVE